MISRWRAWRRSAEFERRLGGRARPPLVGSLIGVEHEYIVRRATDRKRVNFAQLIHRLGAVPRGLDPLDPNAYLMPSGAVVTADETEAEIALAPLATRPGFSHRLVDRVAATSSWLVEHMPAGYFLGEGVSTHLSVAAPERLLERACAVYARAWAPALMLLLDDRVSPGLLVRPRPGRIELAGEFVTGDDLRAAALFALGSVLAVIAGLERRGAELEPLNLSLRMGDQRFGWYVDRAAGGSDLYRVGRSTPLATSTGRPLSAQQLLAAAWALARPQLHLHATPAELALVDELVGARRRLRVERPAGATGASAPDGQPDGQPAGQPARSADEPTAYGRSLGARVRPSFELAPVMVTWQLAVFLIFRPADGRRAFAVVPGRMLGRFLRRLERGVLDATIVAYLDASVGSRRIPARPHVGRAALYDVLYMRPALLPAERALHRPGLPA